LGWHALPPENLALTLYGQVNGASVIYRFSNIDMFGLCFVIVILRQTVYNSVLIDNPVFRLFGKYSYGIYLFQFIWINIYDRHINYQGKFDWTIKFLVSELILLLISFILTHFWDAPIQKMIKKIG
jgi:peptidoglycan/LPS O-acetylase OafA/YrhL